MPVPDADYGSLLSMGKQHVAAGLGRLREHALVKGQGSQVWDEEGSQFLDFTSGIGVVNLGQYVVATGSYRMD
jgi:acetylornithine/succinyldiaminopimelate/putrescine aminotransferase